MALDAGCRGLLVAPAFYFKGVSDDGVFAWFSRLFERTPGIRDVFLYHIPSVTAVGLSAELIGRLRQAFPAVIAGVKDFVRRRRQHGSACWSSMATSPSWSATSASSPARSARARRAPSAAAPTSCPDMLAPVANEGRDDPRVKAGRRPRLPYPVMSAVKALIAHRTGDPAWLEVCPPLEPLTAQQARELTAGFDRIVGAKAA